MSILNTKEKENYAFFFFISEYLYMYQIIICPENMSKVLNHEWIHETFLSIKIAVVDISFDFNLEFG